MIRMIVMSFLLMLQVMVSPLMAQNLMTVQGAIQKIANNAITLRGNTYYPVEELLTVKGFAQGEKIKLLYENNEDGVLFYHDYAEPGKIFQLYSSEEKN